MEDLSDYSQVAETCLIGTGGVTCTAYKGKNGQGIIFAVLDPIRDRENPILLGPIAEYTLKTLDNVLGDVIDIFKL